MIGDILTGLLSGYLTDRLLKLVPPKRTSQFDYLSPDELRSRNNWIEIAANVTFATSFGLTSLYFISFGLNHNLWSIGVWFCFPITLMFLFICLVTLPKGVRRFREFWRFHELKHRIRSVLILILYAPFVLLGMVSTIM